MNEAYLLLGGNLGNRHKIMEEAIRQVAEKTGRIIEISSLYATAPWGFEHEQDFLNQVVKIRTTLSPRKLLDKLLEIENSFGRDRDESGWKERKMDIDILFYGDKVIDEEGLTIPHPRMQMRKFTLVPLAEIAGSFVHPVLNKNIDQLLEECPDELEVKKAET